jgi:pimeloyl-ACP methyl ester carboxylesterase
VRGSSIPLDRYGAPHTDGVVLAESVETNHRTNAAPLAAVRRVVEALCGVETQMCSWEASLGLLVTWARGACGAEEPAGAGPPVLLIMGATGDGGHFHGLVDLLANEYTVVTYDHRGNGRSPRPPGWNTTSNDEQVDDAAELLSSTGLAPAVVFGTSLGAIYALDLLIRHPDAVRGAILHEPPL